MYVDASDNYEFNSRERFPRFSVFNSSVAKGSAFWGGWHMGTMAHAITMATNPATSLPALSLSLSLSLFSLDTRFTRAVCPFSRSVVRSFVRSLVRSLVRSSVSSSACTGVCYPTFFATGSLYIHCSLCLSYPPPIDPVRTHEPSGPLKIARIRYNLVFELTIDEPLFF